MQTSTGGDARHKASGSAYRFGRGVLLLALAINLAGTLARVLTGPFAACCPRGMGIVLMSVYEIARVVALDTAGIWLVIGLLWAYGDTHEGEILRKPLLEAGGLMGFRYTLLALMVLLGEMFFRF